eukprot:TRINITY_DN838_c1_g1_i1.p2 TRINITY_DN838_c1_g1~~TRINITY_DN838_c1_g1_i1.p2  ORF type:complete len:310 (+),score=161.93 TRINITY_DN838_c1_g1_i1:59-931(+)
MADPLFKLRTNFLLQNFQTVVNDAIKTNVTTQEQVVEKDSLVYRSYVGLGDYSVPLSEISSSEPAPLQVVRQLALYFQGEDKSQVVEQIQQWLTEGYDAGEILLIAAATVFANEGNVDEAIKFAQKTKSFEGRLLFVSLLLRINRVDLAEKEVAELQKLEEDNNATQVAIAWTNLHLGGEKLKEAFYIFRDLTDKYGSSPLLLKGLSVFQMKTNKFEEAFETLQEALKSSPNDPDVISNLIVCSQHLNRPKEFIKRLTNQLNAHVDHPWKKALSKFDEDFERAAIQFSGH